MHGNLNGNIGMMFFPTTKRLALGNGDGTKPSPTKTLDVIAGGVRFREFISQIFLSTNASGDIIDAVLNLNKLLVGNASNKPVELALAINQVLGRLSGNIQAIDLVDIWDVPSAEKIKLETDTNWTGKFYTGTALANCFKGQMHYTDDYLYLFVDNDAVIRLQREINKLTFTNQGNTATITIPANNTIDRIIFQNNTETETGDITITDSNSNVIVTETVELDTTKRFATVVLSPDVWIAEETLTIGMTNTDVFVNLQIYLKKL